MKIDKPINLNFHEGGFRSNRVIMDITNIEVRENIHISFIFFTLDMLKTISQKPLSAPILF